MLRNVALLAAAICIVSVLAAGRAPTFLSTLLTGPGSLVESRSAAGEPGAVGRERQVTLRKGTGGHVTVEASVNGRNISMLVDTGASVVALSLASARRLGLEVGPDDYTVSISTANGTIRAAPVRLREIRIGEVSAFGVDAVVMPAGAMDGNLLGMSFLNRLRRFEFRGSELVLTQ